MWAIAVVAGLVVIVFLVLCVPLDLTFCVDVYGKPKSRLRFSWLFGLVSREITREKEKREEKRKATKRKKKFSWRNIRFISRILSTKGVPGRLKELIKDVLSCLKFRYLAADFKIGLGDPVNTGLLFAFLGPATVFFGSSYRHKIRLEPSFSDDAVLEGYLQGTLRLRPIRLVPPFPKFVFSLTTLRIIKALILSKWKRKK